MWKSLGKKEVSYRMKGRPFVPHGAHGAGYVPAMPIPVGDDWDAEEPATCAAGPAASGDAEGSMHAAAAPAAEAATAAEAELVESDDAHAAEAAAADAHGGAAFPDAWDGRNRHRGPGHGKDKAKGKGQKAKGRRTGHFVWKGHAKGQVWVGRNKGQKREQW